MGTLKGEEMGCYAFLPLQSCEHQATDHTYQYLWRGAKEGQRYRIPECTS